MGFFGNLVLPLCHPLSIEGISCPTLPYPRVILNLIQDLKYLKLYKEYFGLDAESQRRQGFAGRG
ncbi:MAG: hypothetical protein ACMG6E_03310 [Candidatus Roizmanbacteria bacterium]